MCVSTHLQVRGNRPFSTPEPLHWCWVIRRATSLYNICIYTYITFNLVHQKLMSSTFVNKIYIVRRKLSWYGFVCFRTTYLVITNFTNVQMFSFVCWISFLLPQLQIITLFFLSSPVLWLRTSSSILFFFAMIIISI